MISKRHKCLFVHIPKTAGQSIEHYFLKLHGLSWEDRASLLLKYNPDKKKGPERLAHLFAKEYVEYGYLDEQEFSGYFKFAFVRNPWDRLVSEYKYRKAHRTTSFRDFVFNCCPQRNLYADTYRHVLPQYDYLYHEEKCWVDFVGKFETLQDDFSYVCSFLKIEDAILPHVNASSEGALSKNTHYTEYYDENTIDFVKNIYEKDVETFSYEYGD